MLRTLTLSTILATSLAAGAAKAQSPSQTNILFILDGSNSMWGQIGQTAKIDTARSVLNQTLSDLSANVTPGLMIYGHRRKDDCSDVELAVPFAAGSKGRIQGAVSAVSPRGKTPIADSLRAAASAFAGREEDNNNILLVSDGIETCGGDPCAIAAELTKRSFDVRVHVVGFDVDAQTREQLQCIAERGNGEYFDARNAQDFAKAIEQAKEVASVEKPAAPPPPPPQPVASGPDIYFEDGFDGDLDQNWTVLNADPDSYLVEDGMLYLVAPDGGPATFASAPNVLRLNKPIPKGDWTITTRFVFKPQTMGESIRVGVAKDHDTSLMTSLDLSSYNYALTNINVRAEKRARGEVTEFARNVMNIESRDREVRSRQFTSKVMAARIRLEKSGRNYISSVRFESTNPGGEGAVTEEWLTVQKLTSLRPPGDAFTLMFGSDSNDYTPGGGEGLAEVDWVRIERK